MNPELKPHYEQFRKIVEEQYLPVLYGKMERQRTFMNEVKDLQFKLNTYVSEANELGKKLNYVSAYKEKLKVAVVKRFNIGDPAGFDEEFYGFAKAADEYLAQIPERVDRKQSKERFRSQPEDTIFVSFLKFFKAIGFGISTIPRRIANLFRKIGGKEPRPIEYWNHHVNLRNLTEYYLKEELIARLIVQKDLVYEKMSSTSQVVWTHDAIIDAQMEMVVARDGSFDLEPSMFETVDEAIAEIGTITPEIESGAFKILDEVYGEYEEDFVRCGTVELSNRKFNMSHLRKEHEQTNEIYLKHHGAWQNTFLLLSDDWGLDIDLYEVIFNALREYQLASLRFDNRIDQSILGTFDPWKEVLKEALTEVKDCDEASLKETIRASQKKIKSTLHDQRLIELNDFILSQDLPSLVNSIEARVDKLVSGIDNERFIRNEVDLNKPTSSSGINAFSPRELINFETLPALMKKTKQVKIKITEKLSAIQGNVLYLGQIAEFNLSSALDLFDDENAENKPRPIAMDGLERTIKQINEIEKNFLEMKELVDLELKMALHQFVYDLKRFTDNENIVELRVRMMKGAALEKGRFLHERVIDKIQTFTPYLLHRGKDLYVQVKEWIDLKYRQFGIYKEESELSAELADFLAETRQSVERLPYVYQRLFKPEPLSDENFFAGRTQELQSLHNAYNNWTKGRFASTAVVGEQGSGMTTLLNFFLQEFTTSCEIFRMRATGTMYTREALLEFLNVEFGTEHKDLDEMLEWMNADVKRVVIIEGVQNCFMKQIGGFEAIQALTELMALTSRNIFWVLGYTEYAYVYLDKTIQLSDHFAYVTRLMNMQTEGVSNIIRKRHKVSGYNILFEPSPDERKSKKFKKMTQLDQQAQLEKAYFSDMNKLAQGNVTLSLIYWLRSTREITDDAIVIGSLKLLDFSFLKGITGDKLYGLATLILHEGMNEANFMQAMSMSAKRARAILHPMYEDGILIMNDDEYTVNPLLYRSTVNLLKSKNIIH